MKSHTGPRLFLILLATLAVAASSAQAQTVVTGQVDGRVLSAEGNGLPGAVVTIRSIELGMSREATTDLQGIYTLEFLTPGQYELRVEAFGYRPVVYPLIRVEAGTARTLDVALNQAPPPVMRVDTAAVASTSLGRWRGSGPAAFSQDLDTYRSLLGGWTSLARFSSDLDPSLGAQGLPGTMTAQVVDGVPFYPARHPYLRGESTGSPAFPAYLLARASVQLDPADVYWLGSPGSTLAADTRAGSGDRSGGVEGSWGGSQLWSSGTLDLKNPPTMTSYRAAMHGGVAIVPDTSHLFVAAEALRQQSPLPARISPDLSATLQGVDPAVLDALGAPSVETVSRISGLARLDRWTGSSRFTLRAAAGHEKRTYDGEAPSRLAYGMGLPEDATDLSAAMSLLSHNDRGFDIEVLGGVSLSDRTWGDASALPAAQLVGPGVGLGQAIGSPAKVTRMDIFASPAVLLPFGPGHGKAGITIQATDHTFDQAFAGDGEVFFSDGAGLQSGDGVYLRGSAAKSSFATSKIGLFAQYDWNAAPGLLITVGGRLDLEKVPSSGVTLDKDWETASGIKNNSFPTRYKEPAGVLAATWDVRGDQRTILFGSASVTNGALDPSLLHEAMSQDGTATFRRWVGTGISWPDVSNGPSGTRSAPDLTLLGPGTRAPRTVVAGGGLVQDLGAGWSLLVSASTRRTDFLPRRRDVNLPIYPRAEDANGRAIFGDLTKIGSVVASSVGTNRRFGSFGAVWAVDPDGWSRYRGASIGLEHTSANSDVFVSYTRSNTTDNWIGAASGLPDAALDPHLPGPDSTSWADGTSDFDVPDRIVAGGRLRLDVARGAEISATYTFQSGRPFTPGYRVGVDANGDGSARNDVAFIPDVSTLGDLATSWSCLANQAGSFAARNSCRGPTSSTLNAGLRLGLLALGGRTVSVTLEGFNLIEDKSGIVDSALLLVDPTQAIGRGANGVVTLPTTVNPNFGKVVVPATRGRILRVGIRIGG